MPIQQDPLTGVGPVLSRFKDALKQYCLAPDKVPVSVEDLAFAAEQVYGLTVCSYSLDVEARHVWGAIIFYEERVEIYIADHLDRAHARFVFAKELGQLILAEARSITDDPVALISGLLQEQRLGGQTPTAPDVASEFIAFIVAIELLFPMDLRGPARARILNGESCIEEEAERLDIPPYVVDIATSDEYAEITYRLWGLRRAAE